MKPNETMDQLIETKLTKTEAIDLLVEEMKDEVTKERDAVKARTQAVRDSVRIEDLVSSMKGAQIQIEVPTSYREDYRITFKVEGKLGKFPAAVQKQLHELNELNDKQELLGKKYAELNDSKGRVRNTILKTMLEGSDKGRQFLQLLGDLKLRVTPKLSARAQKLLSE